MSARKWTPEMEEWLARSYASKSVSELRAGLQERFGYTFSKQAVYIKASKLGLSKRTGPSERGRHAARAIYWTREPEMTAWMLEHDTGSMEETMYAFEKEFGVRLVRTQISLFRSTHGTQQRPPRHGAGRPRVPVGTERVGEVGYVMVKVREEPEVPSAKSNWELKHVLEYERAHGPVPEDCNVYMADGNRQNFDPDNLVAVPRRLMGLLNCQNAPKWYDGDSLRACVALAELTYAMHGAERGGTRKCAVCGREFEPTDKQRLYPKPVSTCPSCVKAGHHAPGVRRSSVPGTKKCAVCGREFEPSVKSQRRCRACINEAPKMGVEQQIRMRRAAS